MSLVIRLRDDKWVLEIKDEVWNIDTLNDLRYELDRLFERKLRYGRIKIVS